MTDSESRIRAFVARWYDLGPWPLGEGAFGRVFPATDLDSGEEVVVKMLREEVLEDPETYSRFLHEIRLGESFRHNHVMPVLASGVTHEGDAWYASPRAQRTLGDAVPLAGMSAVDALMILGQLCAGVEYLHQNRTLHRDLSPGNVMELSGQWVVADFGLSVSEEIARTFRTASSTTRYGTTDFAAPEQLSALRNATTQSDVYAVGKLLQFMLAGFSTPHAPSLTSPARNTILRATAENPASRFETVADLLAAAEMELTAPPFDEASGADRAERYRQLLSKNALPRAEVGRLFLWFASLDPSDEDERRFLLDVIEVLPQSVIRAAFSLDPGAVRAAAAQMVVAVAEEDFQPFSRLDAAANALVRLDHATLDPTIRAAVVRTLASVGAGYDRWHVQDVLVELAAKTDAALVTSTLAGLRESKNTVWVFGSKGVATLRNPLRGWVQKLMADEAP
ncbi:serine/threonine protein kinase [Microbacterium trichothecenolyticum]|uniref:serine/threonine-protein kinase n=1 Tax=Microbacterium trichothecenolyticum TaxID=69370 RepID=UPI001C6E83B8|nr:serine/threonine-protein kinase [Microbacterium trichothecenolyticum]MBW9120779.1 serine/threonine protein kinase [Microbacterium trichothecenolyticum]